MIIAVDFDDTLRIKGKPNEALFNRLIAEQRKGNTVILWTCRSGESLTRAIRFCAECGLRFNYINDNSVETIRRMCGNPRKVYADVYIDDKAIK